MIKTHPISALALAASVAMALSGCGGSGGGSDSNSMTPPPTGGGGGGGSSPSSSIRQTSIGQEAIAAAAGNTPKAGSVTQSSDGDSDNITLDSVDVNVSFSNGQLNYLVNYNGTEFVTTDSSTETPDVEEVLDRPEGTRLHERLTRDTESGFTGIEFYRSLTMAEAVALGLPGAGDIWVDVFTDHGDQNDTDYLAGGIWVYAPEDATQLQDYEYGAFVDGNDPFTQGNLVGLIGSARYEGGATGVYAVTTEDRNYFFDADATLAAEFGTNSELGTISGELRDFSLNDMPVSGNSQLMLGIANIGGSNSGFFTGDTTGSHDGDDSFTGKWGGQFFGNDASNTEPPGSVAGTFGAANSDNTKSLLGVFGAYYTPPSQ